MLLPGLFVGVIVDQKPLSSTFDTEYLVRTGMLLSCHKEVLNRWYATESIAFAR